MSNHRLLGSAFALGLSVLAATGCGDETAVIAGASLEVVNESDFAITEIHLVPIDSPTWGDDLLRGDMLLPGESLLLGVSCDFYDAMLTDEDGVDCELRDLDLCLNDATWVIRNNTCTVFGAAKRSREQQKAEAAKTAQLQ